MNHEFPLPAVETPPEFTSIIDHNKEINSFIDPEHAELLGEQSIAEAKEKAIETEKMLAQELQSGGKEVVYDKYKKSFLIDGEPVTLGQMLASRHFDEHINIPENTAKTFEGKKLVRIYTEYKVRDILTENLNGKLATALAEKTRREDMFKSKAYEAIAERNTKEEKEGETSQEQLGVVAERMMQGIAEMVALDRPDLHLEVRPANAFQDVEEKIDFIISTHTKKRGVGVETNDSTSGDEYEEKNFGIQFTINASKTAFKMDQIEKAKGRATDVDDILLVTIDQGIVRNALKNWEGGGRKMHGPWHYMPENSRRIVIETLFAGVLQAQEIESVQRGF